MNDSADSALRERLRALRGDPPEGDFAAALHRKLVAAGPPEPATLRDRLREAWAARAALWTGLATAAACALIVLLAMPRHAQVDDAGRDRGVASGGNGGANNGGSNRNPAPGETLASAEVPVTKAAMVRFNLSAEVAVQSAQLRVALPEGLVFWNDGQQLAQRSFEWKQPLNAGDNEIPIAVRGLKPGRYRMTVTAKLGEQSIEDEVVLEVVDG